MSRKGILLILDGYGEGKDDPFNAVKNANTPTLDALHNKNHSLLKTDGEAVGLFAKELGGSEVGHTTIGAGRVVPSVAKKIHDDLKSGAFYKNKDINRVFDKLNQNGGDLHLIGLMSDKNIHSDINHAIAILKMAQGKAKNIYIHFITDGRDTGSFDSLKYLKLLKKNMSNYKNCEIASVMGRFYAMDRENNLDRTQLAVDYMFNEAGTITENEIETHIKNQHKKGITDEYIYPVHIKTKNEIKISNKDCVFFFNFREDRLRQIVKMTSQICKNIVTMSSVSSAKTVVLYTSNKVKNTLSEFLSKQNLRQVKISETTKYAHVTYFLNGGYEEPFKNEDRVHVPTIKTDNFSKTPKMRAKEITDEVLKAIDENYDAIIVNYSNPDMLGHTGDYDATVKSLFFVDKCVKKVIDKARRNGYFLLITADHGNSEMMRTPEGLPHTAHTFNRVMCVILDQTDRKMRKYGELKDVAPTFLELMELPKNKYFEGKSLIL